MVSSVVHIVKYLLKLIVMRIKKEFQSPKEGNYVIINIETEKGDIVPIQVICPICGATRYWLSEDHKILYCAKCSASLGQRREDLFFASTPSWEV